MCLGFLCIYCLNREVLLHIESRFLAELVCLQLTTEKSSYNIECYRRFLGIFTLYTLIIRFEILRIFTLSVTLQRPYVIKTIKAR